MEQETNVYEKPAYWNGEIGYRSPGYHDFDVNIVKDVLILIQKPKSVLDIGCAYGYIVGHMLGLGIPAKGLDISKYAISQASNKVKSNLVHGDVRYMPFKYKEFDLAFCSGVLEHIPQDSIEKAVSEIVRVSNRGIIGVACSDDDTSAQDEDVSHEMMLTQEEWQALFPVGYKVISDSTMNWKITTLASVHHVMQTLKEVL